MPLVDLGRRINRSSNTNQIQKVYLMEIDANEEAPILIKLCSEMNYLQVNDLNTINVKVFLSNMQKHIISEGHDHLRSLSIRVPSADDQIIK